MRIGLRRSDNTELFRILPKRETLPCSDRIIDCGRMIRLEQRKIAYSDSCCYFFGVADSEFDSVAEGAGSVELAEVGLVEDSVVLVWRSMTVDAVCSCLESKASPSEVNMKMIAAATVTLLRKVPGPRLPNTVWLDPPNAAPISAPLPA